MPRRRRRRSWLRRHRRALIGGLGLGLALVVLIGGLAAREAIELRRNVRLAKAEIDLAVAASEPVLADFSSFREADLRLRDSATHLATADGRLAAAQRHERRLGPLIALAGALPGWPRGLHEIAPLLSAGRNLARAGRTESAAFSRMTAALDNGNALDPVGARLSAGLAAGEPGFRAALADFDAAQADRRRVDGVHLTGPLTPARDALAIFDRRIPDLYDNALLLAQLPEAAREVLGLSGPRTYAVIGQNSAELRPTGGFMGSMGMVSLERGGITREDYRGVYTFERLDKGFNRPPEPFARYMGVFGWALRDANWSPDFPTAAQQIEQFLNYYGAGSVNGVIGFTTYAVGGLLDALGPLPVAGLSEPVTAATWYDLAEQVIYFNPDDPNSEQNKGEVLGPVLQAMVSRMQHASPDELPKLLRTLQTLVQQRQLLVYFHDAAPATIARRANADGRFAPPATGDVLAVVDANMSYSKVGPYIDEQIRYETWLDERGDASASEVTVSYSNRITPAIAASPTKRIGGVEYDAARDVFTKNPGVYGTYARVYIPSASRILDLGEAAANVISNRELGFRTLEHYESVPAASSRAFRYRYQPPADRSPDGLYQLLVIKQPGTANQQLEVRLHLPEGLAAAPSLPLAREGDALVYRGPFLTNLNLRVGLGGAGSGTESSR